MAKTWYTHPENQFDSFYYFDDTTRELVRIRLELGRKSGSGDTKAMYEPDRYFGFSTDASLDVRDLNLWTVDKGTVQYNGRPLESNPTKDYWTYDFALRQGEKKPREIHPGNKVATSGQLPKGITEKELITLAQKAIARRGDIVLTKKDATPEQLSQAILAVVKE